MGQIFYLGLILTLGFSVLKTQSDPVTTDKPNAGPEGGDLDAAELQLIDDAATGNGTDSMNCPPAMQNFEKEKYEGQWYLTHMSRQISLEAECYEADSLFYNKAQSVNITVRLLPKGMSKEYTSEHDFMDLMVEWKGTVGYFTTKEKVTGQREGPLKIIGTDYTSYSVTRYCHHNRAYEGYLVYGRVKSLPDAALKSAQAVLSGFSTEEKLYPIPRCSK